MKTNASHQTWSRKPASASRGTVWLACALFFLPSAMTWAADSTEPPARLVFGGDANYPPFESLTDGVPRGFTIDLEAAIGEMGRVPVEHRLADWPDTVHALETGVVDAVPMFESERRKQKFLFAPPFFYVDHGIYARPNNSKVAYASDLAGKAVVVEQSSYAHDRIRNDLPDVTLMTEPNTLGALRAVEAGRAEYAVLATISADRLIRSHDLELRRTGPPLWPSPYAFAVRKDNVELHRWLTRIQTQLFTTGRYQTVFQRWEPKLVPGATTLREIADVLVIILMALIALGAFGFGTAWYLRRAVAARTRELSQELERRKAAETRIRYFSDYDTHTDLPKRHHFMELANQVLTTGNGDKAPAAVQIGSMEGVPMKEVAAIRLAKISSIIPALGYSAYYDIVQQFAQRLKGASFDLCGYLGREVFAVLGSKGAVNEHFEQMISPLTVHDLEFHPQVIWGSAYWPEHGESVDALIRRAETALAVANFAQKRTSMVYHPSMEPDPKDLQLLSDFSRSKGEGLYAVFQPQVDLRTGRITAAEALVRWHHPELGHISPGRFVPLLENAGLVGVVTERMLHQAAAFAAGLRQEGYNCPISVNITVYDLLGAGFIETVSTALRQNDANPKDIKLELTETGTFENVEHVQSALSELTRLGIIVAVDDFGTGYSSLSYLSAFPIREVKIDVQFVRDMLRKPRHRNL